MAEEAKSFPSRLLTYLKPGSSIVTWILLFTILKYHGTDSVLAALLALPISICLSVKDEKMSKKDHEGNGSSREPAKCRVVNEAFEQLKCPLVSNETFDLAITLAENPEAVQIITYLNVDEHTH